GRQRATGGDTLYEVRTSLLTTTTALAFLAASAACSSGPSAPPTATTSAAPNPSVSASASPPGPMKITDPYSPTIVPSVFTTKIDNPYFPLTPGTRTISEAATADGLQRTTTDVTRDTRKVMGVDTVVVHDTVTVDNEPLEDTFDWYAQDRDGNVWYFGEVTKEYKDGSVDTAGSFEGGVNGACPASSCRRTRRSAISTGRSTRRASRRIPARCSVSPAVTRATSPSAPRICW